MDGTGTALPISYFGKLPSQGDFVRTSDNHQLMLLLDRWAGQGVELLTQDPAWKQTYDNAASLHFAFLGSRSRLAVAGHFLPSRDASQRRFPFLSATRFEVMQPLGFIGRAPMALTRLWASLSRQGKLAISANDASEPLRELAENRIAVNADHAAYEASFADFLDTQNIDTLQSLLHGSGHPQVSLKTLLPALGLLLQPVLTGGASQIDKGLALPLPRDALYRPLVAALWLDLISGFVSRAEFELAILVKDGAAPQLLIGFNGADGRILQAGLDPQAAGTQLIQVAEADWVEELLTGDYALNKLASYLQHDELSLRVVRKAFAETFIGV